MEEPTDAGFDYDQFDPKSYLDFYYDSPCKEWEELIKFILENLHGVFSKGKISGKRLLDVGTGPSIHNIISASRYVQEIYLSDFAEKNRDTLCSWLNGQEKLQDKQFDYVLRLEDEGQMNEDRQSEIKKKVKKVYPIDVTVSPPIESEDKLEQFDVITTSWCFESASNSKEEYRACVQNIAPLLKKEGYFILIGDLGSPYYLVGDVKFTACCIGNQDLKDIYREEGFQILTWREWVKMKNDFQEYSTVIMVAKKVR